MSCVEAPGAGHHDCGVLAWVCTYRQMLSGRWVVRGPAHMIRRGARVLVTRKDGTLLEETIRSAGRPFEIHGVQLRYGYIDAPAMCPECGQPRHGPTQ